MKNINNKKKTVELIVVHETKTNLFILIYLF